jgi:hypothetical protein
MSSRRLCLIDIARKLNSPDNNYHGFDISAVQFPSDVTQGFGTFNFTVHDFTKRFPVEYHSQFDLVNVRLVVQALKSKDVASVVSNLLELLRTFHMRFLLPTVLY